METTPHLHVRRNKFIQNTIFWTVSCCREEFPNLSGLDDKTLTNPTSMKPPFRFGTIPNGATDYVIKNNFPDMHDYIKK